MLSHVDIFKKLPLNSCCFKYQSLEGTLFCSRLGIVSVFRYNRWSMTKIWKFPPHLLVIQSGLFLVSHPYWKTCFSLFVELCCQVVLLGLANFYNLYAFYGAYYKLDQIRPSKITIYPVYYHSTSTNRYPSIKINSVCMNSSHCISVLHVILVRSSTLHNFSHATQLP